VLSEERETVFANLGRLKIELGRGLVHTRGILADERCGIALEDADYLFDISGIFFLGIGSDAGALTLPDVEVEAGTIFVAKDGLRVNLIFTRT
jgi:hypothetical protein